MVAVRMEEQDGWPSDVQHLLLPISRDVHSGIKGDAVVVGRVDDVLICRYFASRYTKTDLPAVGDHASVDFSTSREMQESWRAGRK